MHNLTLARVVHASGSHLGNLNYGYHHVIAMLSSLLIDLYSDQDQEARAMVDSLRQGMADRLASQGLGRAREFLTPGRLLYFEKFKSVLHEMVRRMAFSHKEQIYI